MKNRLTWTRGVAAMGAALLAFVGFAPSAIADAQLKTAVNEISVSADGIRLTVSGTGYTDLPNASSGKESAGVYAALRDKSTMSNEAINVDTGIVPAVEYVWAGRISSGAWSANLNAPASALSPEAEYEVIVWVAHGDITDTTLLDAVAVDLTEEQRAELFGSPAPEPDPTPEPAPEPAPAPEPDPTPEPESSSPPEAETAPKPVVDIKVTSVGKGGLELAVIGTGFDDLPKASTGKDSAGVYAALRDKKTMSFEAINKDTGIVPAVSYVWSGNISDGMWETSLKAGPADLDQSADYEVIVWVAHGDITEGTLLNSVPLELTASEVQALFAKTGTTPTPSPAAKPESKVDAPELGNSEKHEEKPKAATAPEVPGSEIVCTTETVPAKAGTPRMSWGVKSSFVSYIQGGIAKGSVSTSNGAARTGGTLTWGAGTGTLSSNGQGTLRFPGVVHFSGHGGVLNTTFTNVRVQVNAGGAGALIADVKSQDMEGNDVSGYGITVANLRFTNAGASGGTASATLTSAGARALAGFYSAGESMDSVRISFAGASGATTEEVCYDADGNRVNADGTSYTGAGGPGLAATGAEPSVAGLAAVGAILLGAMLIGIRSIGARRRGEIR